VRSLFLKAVPLFPLLLGLIQSAATVTGWRHGTFRSSVLEHIAVSVFLISLSMLFLLVWPWAVVGSLARHMMHVGLAAVAGHGLVAPVLAYRAGRLLPARTGRLVSAFLVLMSVPCLLGVGHVLLAPFPDDHVPLAFPLDGDWSVGQGGASVLTNAHAHDASQRYALDLVKIGPDGKCFKGDGRHVRDHLSWSQPVRAPLSGTVIQAFEVYPDNEPGQVDDRDSRGNHVLIRSVAGDIVLLAHLKMHSVLVAEGDTVTEGQLIAEVGNSGNTSRPHLHLDASRATHVGVVSVPMIFKGLDAGIRSQRRGATLGLVRPRSSPSSSVTTHLD
jgi:hypothetical protein